MRIIALIAVICSTIAAQGYMAQYNQAIELIEQGKTAEAREILGKVAQFPAETGLRDNAAYWTAVTYFDEGRYDLAIENYKAAQNLPDGNKAAAAQYELAYAKEKAGDTTGAVIEFYKLQTLYPNSGLVERADSAIKALGGPINAYVPNYGPESPSVKTELARVAPKEAEPLASEPRPDAPLQQTEELRPDAPLHQDETGPVIATEGPLTGAELPVAPKQKPEETSEKPKPKPLDENKPQQAEAEAKEAEPLAKAQPKTKTQPTEREAANGSPPVKEPEGEEVLTDEPEGEEADAEEEKIEKKEEGVIYDDSAPLDVDPSRLIRPEDKAGWE